MEVWRRRVVNGARTCASGSGAESVGEEGVVEEEGVGVVGKEEGEEIEASSVR